jgi:C1A family cysteine protease
MKGDTWTLTRSMQDHVFESSELGGHEMIIIGYDDNAVVQDNEGYYSHGVFRLRNSWGPNVGDQGDYYMTYDFFKRFVIEVQRLVKSEKPIDLDE